MKYRMFGQAASKIYNCFGLCNVMTIFDPRFEKLFYEDFNGGNLPRYFNFPISKVTMCNFDRTAMRCLKPVFHFL
jgi:hypothetical protein